MTGCDSLLHDFWARALPDYDGPFSKDNIPKANQFEKDYELGIPESR